MAAESITSAVVCAAAVSMFTFIAGASGIPDAQTAKEVAASAVQSAEAVETLIRMSDDRIVYLCFAGGIGGGMVAIAFGLYKDTSLKEISLRLLGSGLFSGLMAPSYILYFGSPTLIPVLSTSCVFGLLGYTFVMGMVPLFKKQIPKMFKAIVLSLFGIKTDDTKEKTEPLSK